MYANIIISIIIILILVLVQIYNYDEMTVYTFSPDESGEISPKICIIGSVHGNEPVGYHTLTKMINEGAFDDIKRGTLIVIPDPNKVGIYLNNRMQFKLTNRDLNRNFGVISRQGKTINKAKDRKSRQILNLVKDCDLVIDVHEGWGFNNLIYQQGKSLGSTLSPSNDALAQKLAMLMLAKVNSDIDDPIKKFNILLGRSCEINGTLACNSQTNGRSHVLIEISGQNNIQPMYVREKQLRTLLEPVLNILY